MTTAVDRTEYHIVSRWLVDAPPAEVESVLRRLEDVPRWWPGVFLDLELLDPGDPDLTGRTVRARARGRLPYALRCTFRVVRARPPARVVVTVGGDLEGRCVCTCRETGAERSELLFDWRVRAVRPLVRRLSPWFRPLFAANHRWVMRRGRLGLSREIVRRRQAAARVGGAGA